MDAGLYERALSRTEAIVANTTVGQLDDPTSCGSWKVRDLLNHLIGGMAAYAAGAAGRPLPSESDDHIGDDPAGNFRRAATDALDAFRAPDAMERTFKMPWGDTPGSVALGLAVSEAGIHGWDLAKATRQPATIDDDVAEAIYNMTSSMMEPLGGFPRGGSFADPVEVPEDAPIVDKTVAYLGRRP